MKRLIIPLITGVVMSCAYPSTKAQEYKETINKEFILQKDEAISTLAIYNICGSIKVEGYAGDKVICKVNKTISAKTNIDLEEGKREFRLEFLQNTDSIIAFIAEPFDSRPHRNWNKEERDHEITYEYNLEFIVKVPVGMNLKVSTVNNGEIDVQEASGKLDLLNVNGSITVNNAKGNTKAFTVNGNIVINYLSNPPGQSSYHTINGDIKVNYQADLSADMQFKSMHGEFYTDFPNAEVIPASVSKCQHNEGAGTTYILNKNTTVRFGAGGKLFDFETLNGNVYIKKQS